VGWCAVEYAIFSDRGAMMIETGKKYLVTSDVWFTGPDGDSYLSAWGTAKVLNIEEMFGFKVSRPSTNWYLKLGDGDRSIIIAGCQIHVVIECDKRPVNKEGEYVDRDNAERTYKKIYYAEGL